MNFLARIGRELHWHGVTKTLLALLTWSARVRVVTTAPLPRTGGFILASNHVSHFDPPVITTHFPRRIDWIAMIELFQGKFLHRFFTELNVIPVDRTGADRSALRTAVKRLRDGRVVGIFPEGGIRDGPASIVNGAKMKEGVALLASMSGAPIVPCVILGSDRLYHKKYWLGFRRAPVYLAFGAPITTPTDFPADQKRSHLQKEFSTAIVALRERLQSDFQLTADDLPHSPQERMHKA